MGLGGKSESGVTGVFQVRRKIGPAKWTAEINSQGMRYCLGTFDTMEEAIAERERQCFGLFGTANTPAKYDPYLPSPAEKLELSEMEYPVPHDHRTGLYSMMLREAV